MSDTKINTEATQQLTERINGVIGSNVPAEDELSHYHKSVVSGLLISLIGVMEETDDPDTKERLDEQIKTTMNELNLTWEDIG